MPSSQPAPCCYECLTEDVAVKVIDEFGFEHWFCAADWAAGQELHDRIMALFGVAVRAVEQAGA
jgi:hypothetical protein